MPTKIASAKKLIINKLTQAQYDSIPEKDPAQLYLITDAEVSGGTNGFTKEEADTYYIQRDESGAAMFDMISRTQGQIEVPNKSGTIALLSDLENYTVGEGVIIPSQENNGGKFLTTDGNNLSWAEVTASNTNIQVTEMPEATEENFGMIVQYVGESTEQYVKGFFYENSICYNTSIEHEIANPSGYRDIDVVLDIGVFSEVVNNIPGTYTFAEEGMEASRIALYNESGEVILAIETPDVEDFADFGIVDFVYPNGQSAMGPGIVGIKVNITLGKSIGYMWAMAPTQLVLDPIPSQEGNAGKILSTDGSTAMWIDAPSYPDNTSDTVARYEAIQGWFSLENGVWITFNSTENTENTITISVKQDDTLLDKAVLKVFSGTNMSPKAEYLEKNEYLNIGVYYDIVYAFGQLVVHLTSETPNIQVYVQSIRVGNPSNSTGVNWYLGNEFSLSENALEAEWKETNNISGGLTQEQADALYMKKSENGGVELGETTLVDRAGDFKIHTTGDESTGIHITGHGAVYPENPNNEYATLGNSYNKWIKTYTQTLNNGEDIQVPNKAGTLALLSDLEGISGGEGGLTQEQADLLYAKKDDTGAVEIKEIYNSEGYHIAIPDQGNLAADDSSTYAATTAWVQRAIDSKLSGIESILDELNGETLEG